jgi:hypothetical protein
MKSWVLVLIMNVLALNPVVLSGGLNATGVAGTILLEFPLVIIRLASFIGRFVFCFSSLDFLMF